MSCRGPVVVTARAGTRFGDPRWINPRAMLTLGGRLAAAGLMILQISFWIAVVSVKNGMLS